MPKKKLNYKKIKGEFKNGDNKFPKIITSLRNVIIFKDVKLNFMFLNKLF